MKIKIECEIEVDDVWFDSTDQDAIDWFMELLDNEEGMTNVRLWSNEVGDEIGYTSKFKYEIL
jgi:hypothetical protein